MICGPDHGAHFYDENEKSQPQLTFNWIIRR